MCSSYHPIMVEGRDPHIPHPGLHSPFSIDTQDRYQPRTFAMPEMDGYSSYPRVHHGSGDYITSSSPSSFLPQHPMLGTGMMGARRMPPVPIPMGTPGLDAEMCMSMESPYSAEQHSRYYNLCAQLANSQIPQGARYAQVHPMLTRQGRPPSDFRTAKTVEEMRFMDPAALERILYAYQLPADPTSLSLVSLDTLSSRAASQARLNTLFEFLGASRLVNRDRLRMSRRALLASI